MPCPFYLGLTSENPLKVCGPKERLGYAPSAAHLRMFCLSISAHGRCPIYRTKMGESSKVNRWMRFLKQVFGFFQGN